MALGQEEEPPQRNITTVRPWQPRHRLSLRRRKVQTVRLGGKKPRRRMLILASVIRKMRLRWLKLQYVCMLRRIKECYRSLLKDMVEAGDTIQTFQQRLFLESTLAIPVGVTFSSYPSRFGSDRPRSIFM